MICYVNIDNFDKETAVEDVLNEIVSFMQAGEDVEVEEFGKAKLGLRLHIDNGDFSLYTFEYGQLETIYESPVIDAYDFGAIRAELEKAWDFTLLEIRSTRETGGNILTISGVTTDGYFFVCDQYGDGAILDDEYNPEWTYDEYLEHQIGVLDKDNAREILALIED